ncbi:hypothetical protein HanXRQr2_Chr07g0311121 [Helianthus annuus]|uniref:Uncharacterized protein n=1 Tax=Helianthus annuus TaxID=4232 RepID=A0A9K3IN36_HELAN|nr:hypothetical protein HanXRQr2_Chr07g0311121 [Helianthus annuus]
MKLKNQEGVPVLLIQVIHKVPQNGCIQTKQAHRHSPRPMLLSGYCRKLCSCKSETNNMTTRSGRCPAFPVGVFGRFFRKKPPPAWFKSRLKGKLLANQIYPFFSWPIPFFG